MDAPVLPPVADATILFTTKNRRDDLRRALASALMQEGVVIEILVIDDGSTDGTSEMVRTEFPGVRLERREESAGYIVRRNEGVRLANAAVVFSLDDDAGFSSPHTVAQTLPEFSQALIGAVAIPFVNVLHGPQVWQQAPEDAAGEIYVADSFIGTAHALRRELFLALGGYREHLLHQGEEGDYCLRMLAAGYVVRMGRAEPIHHFESSRRDWRRMDFYGRRNDVLFVWHNVPARDFPVHLTATIFNGLRFAAGHARSPWQMVRGLARGCVDGLRYWHERKPVPRAVYRLHRRLKKSGPVPLRTIASQLPLAGHR